MLNKMFFFNLTSAMRTRMYLDIHIMSAPSMPTQGPTWYSCFFFDLE